MKKGEKMILKKDLVIPAGTEFNCIDGIKRTYTSGNHETIIGVGKDATFSIVINEDCELLITEENYEDAMTPMIECLEKIISISQQFVEMNK